MFDEPGETDKPLPFLDRSLNDGVAVAIGDVYQVASSDKRGDGVGRVPDSAGREENIGVLNGHSIHADVIGLAHGISSVYDASGVVFTALWRRRKLDVWVLLTPLVPQVAE